MDRKTEKLVAGLKKLAPYDEIVVIQKDGDKTTYTPTNTCGSYSGIITVRVGQAAVDHMEAPGALFYFSTEESATFGLVETWEVTEALFDVMEEMGTLCEAYNGCEFLVYED
jgi:hypothetical protein